MSIFNPDGTFTDRAKRILAEQTIPPRYGLSPAMQALPLINQPHTREDVEQVIKLIDEEQD